MKWLNILTNRKGILLLVALMGTGMLATAQLKIGDNPTSIQKSSILELESTRQGLLLPQFPWRGPPKTSERHLLPPARPLYFVFSRKKF